MLAVHGGPAPISMCICPDLYLEIFYSISLTSSGSIDALDLGVTEAASASLLVFEWCTSSTLARTAARNSGSMECIGLGCVGLGCVGLGCVGFGVYAPDSGIVLYTLVGGPHGPCGGAGPLSTSSPVPVGFAGAIVSVEVPTPAMDLGCGEAPVRPRKMAVARMVLYIIFVGTF